MMKTFSKRFLTMLLAVAMVFSLSGMTTFAAETDDADAQQAAEADALSEAEESVQEETEPEAVAEEVAEPEVTEDVAEADAGSEADAEVMTLSSEDENYETQELATWSSTSVCYAVKIYGINKDTYSTDDGTTTGTAGLTFGPALGDNYTNSFVSCSSSYCIHNLSWQDIIDQCAKDPTVFQSCMENGCTKAVELTPNSKLFNSTTVNNAANQNYSGDGVSTLYNLLTGTGAEWNASTSANIYSESRIRNTLIGSEGGSAAGSSLCDSSNCLFSCFPEELQNAIVPRKTENSNSSNSSTAGDKTTYDKLFLLSLKEAGDSSDTDDGGGEDYGVNPDASDRVPYEFSGTSASSASSTYMWTRSRVSSGNGNAYYYDQTGYGRAYAVWFGLGLSPCFCLAGASSSDEPEPTPEPTSADVKYAVSVWGINQDVDEEGNTLGLTFGPATGADYTSDSKSHLTEDQVSSGEGYCIHWMDWDAIAEQSKKDPTVFDDCLKNGCTKAVDITLNDTIAGTKYPDMAGDGAGMLYDSINSDYRMWNASGGNYGGNTGGWPASRIRTTLNGNSGDAGTYAGDNLCTEENCLFSCLPTDLQDAIVAKAVHTGTVWNSQTEANSATTYDKLWLFSGTEVYGEGSSNAIIHPYEGDLYKRSTESGITTSNYSGLVNYEENGKATHKWWLRTIPTSSTANANVVMTTGDWASNSVTGSSSTVGFSFGFCMAGGTAASVTNVTIDSGLTDNTKVYDGKEITLTVSADVEPADTEVTYNWSKDGVAINADEADPTALAAKADGNTLTIDGNVADSGTYTCEVVAGSASASGDIAISVTPAEQKIVFEKESVEAQVGDDDFTNGLTDESVIYGSLQYDTSNASVASIDDTGKVTIVGAGEATITCTASADTENDPKNYEEAQATYTVTVTEAAAETVKYAVKVWGIGVDEDENGNKLGLTFGPATGTSYMQSYVSRETVLEKGGSHDSTYCIHDMTWDEIIAQNAEDPTVFEDCKTNGCTKAVELTPNEKLFNMDVVSAAQSYLTGDGVSTLYYLLNGDGAQYYSYGLAWNASTSGSSSSNLANLYSKSRMRVALNGDSSDAGSFAGSDLCDETNCLLSCFPGELQEAIVPRATVNAGGGPSWVTSANDETTYDKLWLLSPVEAGVNMASGSDYYDGGGTDYGIATSVRGRYAYEFSSAAATASTARQWWARSRSASNAYYVYYFSTYGSASGNASATYGEGVSPCFCLPGATTNTTETYNVKYAVSIWGIKQDTCQDADGNVGTAGLTFGPATGTDYTSDYKAHLTEDEYKASDDAYCIHWMSWDEIAEQSKTDPTVFEDCLKAGCTHSVDITLNDKLLHDSYDSMAGDGAGILYESIQDDYKVWNDDFEATGGWPASRVRATLNGKDDYTNTSVAGSDALDAADSLYACFPSDLQDAIVAKAVKSDTVYDDTSGNNTTTYDKLWLFSGIEMWASESGGDNDCIRPNEGALYERSSELGIATDTGYELYNFDEDSESGEWWTRTLDQTGGGTEVYYVLEEGTPDCTYPDSSDQGLAPGFCLAGPEPVAPTVSDVEITAAGVDEDNAKTYNGVGVSLTASATVDPEDAEVAYQWYKVAADGTETAIDGATHNLLTTGSDVSDSGTYKCTVTATNDGLTASADGTITITINKAEQKIVFTEESVEKETTDAPFTNDLTSDSVVEGALTYESSEPSIATVDENGEVSILAAGEVKITATAAATDNYEEASASYTITITKPAVVNYAVKIWGIQADKYSKDGGDTTQLAGLTFGPALGADYTTTSKSHLTEDEYNASEDAYCIHWMTWDEIIAQSEADPTVFEDCKSNGCTKTVELTPNEKLFNMTVVNAALAQNYTGDGVSTLYYLLNGSGSTSYDTGANWNSSTSFNDSDPGNLYSQSRIRVTLNGDASDAGNYAGSGLCDSTNCLLSCFPSELQEAIVPRATVNAGILASWGTSANDKETYDKLWLLSPVEAGIDMSSQGYYDGGGTDYGIAKSVRDRYAYEFTTASATAKSARYWWTRSRYDGDDEDAYCISNTGGAGSKTVTSGYGVSPCFSLAGPDVAEPTVSDVEIKASGLEEDNSKTYDGTGVTLTASATVTPDEDVDVTYQWYTVAEDGTETAIEDATEETYTTGANVADSGTYKFEVTAKNTAGTATGSAEITITIKPVAQDISYETTEITKAVGDDSFTNDLTEDVVSEEDGAGISYVSSEESVATVDASTGAVTIEGAGETTITATAAATANYAEATASYTLTVEEKLSVSVTITSNATDNTKAYNGAGVNLTATAEANIDGTEFTYQWYGPDGNAIENETSSVYITGSNVADSGIYKCEVKAVSAHQNTDASGEIEITITQAEQDISYVKTQVTKYVDSDPFTNRLTQAVVYGEITYASSDETIAKVDTTTGEVTLTGETGAATITATAAGGDNYVEASASYELVVATDDVKWEIKVNGGDEEATWDDIMEEYVYTQTYDGKALELEMIINEDDLEDVASVAYEWQMYNRNTFSFSDIPGEESSKFELNEDRGNVRSGDYLYMCIVTVNLEDGTKLKAYGTVEVIINKIQQEISYEKDAVTECVGVTSVPNDLTETVVSEEVGAGITYASSDETIATVDENTGEVTCVAVGEATITATAASTDNYAEATASYTLTVDDHSWGDVTWTWAADYSSAEASRTCKACGTVETAEATVSYTTTATATEAGVTTYTATATFSSDDMTVTDTVTEDTQAIDPNGYITVNYGDNQTMQLANETIDAAIAKAEDQTFTYNGNEITKPFVLISDLTGITDVCSYTVTDKDGTYTRSGLPADTYLYWRDDKGCYRTAVNNGSGRQWVDEPGTITVVAHDWGDVTWTWADDYSSATASRTCTVCGETETAEATVTSEVKTAVRATENGETDYTATATFSSDDTTVTTTEEVTIQAVDPEGSITIVHGDDTFTIANTVIDAAIDAVAEPQTFDKGGDEDITAKFVLISDLTGITDVCSYTVTASDNFETSGLPADTYLYWRDDINEYCTAVDGGSRKLWAKEPATIEVITTHTWGDVTWTWADDYSSAEASRTCTVCGETETATATITSEETTPMATKDGETVYTATATFSSDDTTVTDTKTVTIPAVDPDGHIDVVYKGETTELANTTIDAAIEAAKEQTFTYGSNSVDAQFVLISDLTGISEVCSYTVTGSGDYVRSGLPADTYLYWRTDSLCYRTAVNGSSGGSQWIDGVETIEVIPHTLGSDVTWTWSDDLSSATATRTCSVCGKTETVDATVTSEETTTPMATKDGVETYTATATFSDGVTETAEKTKAIAAVNPDGHIDVVYNGVTTELANTTIDAAIEEATPQEFTYESHGSTNTLTEPFVLISDLTGIKDFCSYTVTGSGNYVETGLPTDTYLYWRTDRLYYRTAVNNGEGNQWVNDVETIEVVPHTLGSDVTWNWSDDLTSATASRTCSVCGETETVDATVTSEETTTPMATKDGVETYTATATFSDGVTETDEKTKAIAAVDPDGHIDVVYKGETTELANTTIDAAIEAAKEQTFTYGSNSVDAQFVLISDLTGISEVCSYTVTGSGDYVRSGLPADTYLYWRTDRLCYRTAVNGSSGGGQWIDGVETIEVIPHTLGEDVKWNWSDDYSSATATRTCSVCGETVTVFATITSEETTTPMATKDGVETYTATATFSDGVTVTDEKTKAIAAVDPDGHINVVYNGETTELANTTIDAAIEETTPQEFTYESHGSTNTLTEPFVLISDLTGIKDFCSYTVTGSGNYVETGLPTDTYLYWRTDRLYYRTAVNNGEGNQWVNEVETIEIVPHDWSVTWDWADDYSSATATRTCTVCDASETVTAVVTSETTEPQVGVDGQTVYTATATFSDGTTATDTKTVDIPALVEPTVSVEITSNATDNTKDYDGAGVNLTATATVEPDTAEIGSYQWYTVAEDGTETAIDGATSSVYITGSNVSDSGTYKCVVTATNDGLTESGSGEITITINVAAQDISYDTTLVTKFNYDEDFINELTKTTVFGDITYESSEESVATVDETTGEVAIKGTGTTTITATAAGGDNYKEATASYVLVVNTDKIDWEVEVNGREVTWDEDKGEWVDDLTYNGQPLELEMEITLDEGEETEEASIAYQWSLYDPDSKTFTAITGATASTYTLEGDYVNAGDYLYMCTVTVTYKNGDADSVQGPIEVTIEKDEQNISYAETAVTKDVGEGTFTNELTETKVSTDEDAAITYTSSDESVATIDANGEVTIVGVGETTITATAAGTTNFTEASASYTLTVNDHTWGEVTWTWAANYKSATASRTCTICGKEDSVTTEDITHTTTATATKAGETTYTATATFEDGTEVSDTVTVEVDAIDPNGYITIISTTGEESQLTNETIDEAIEKAPEQTFTYTSRGNENSVTKQFVLISDLTGMDDFCSYTVTASDGYKTTGLPTDTYLYWRDDDECYRTAVNGGSGSQWSNGPVTIELIAHTWDVEWNWADDYSSATATGTCSVCDATETVDATISITTTDPTAAEDGETVYTATATFGDGTVVTDTKTVTIPALVAPTVKVDITSTIEDNTKTYDGVGVSLTANVTVTPDTSEIVSYQWYTVAEDGTETAIEGATTNLLNIDGHVSDSGTYKCTVTATNEGLSRDGSGEITITIEKAAQDISYGTTLVNKYYYDEDFINELTKTTVFGDITYASSEESVATVVDATTGEIDIMGIGAATITATVAGSDDYEEATASYVLTVNADNIDWEINVNNRAVKWDEDKGEYVADTTYIDEPMALDMEITLDEGEAEEMDMITYQWYRYNPETLEFEEMIGETYATLTLDGDFINAGDYLYMCIVTVSYENKNDDTVYGTIEVTIEKAQQEISYDETALKKTVGDVPFINDLNQTTVDARGGATITYTSSDETIATVDENGLVTILTNGEVTITATVSETTNYEGASASYTITIAVNKTALQEEYDEDIQLDEDDYTPASWAPFEEALASAKEVLDNDEATQKQIDDALAALQSAKADLVEKADKTVLESAITTAEVLDESEYTPESWAALEAALEAAKTVDADVNATQDDVDKAAIDLISAVAGLESIGEETDKAALLDEYAKDASLDSSDYTPESWTPFEEALTNAQEVLLNTDATQDEIDAALQELETAAGNLVAVEKVDKTELQKEVDEADALNESDYTPDSWEPFETALEQARDVLADTTATQDDVNQALAALQDAKDNLVEKADKSVLNDMIDTADALTESDYTPESWTALEGALDAAKTVSGDENATQDQVDSAMVDLLGAIAGLKPADETAETPDKDALLTEYVDDLSLNESDYTPESWAPFAQALTDAQSVLLDPTATQDEIDAALDALVDAKEKLEPAEETPAVDKEGLEGAIEAAEALDENDFTAETWQALQNALGAAKAVDADENATQDQVDSARVDLLAAIAGLKPADETTDTADKDALLTEYVDDLNLNESDYTPESWEPFAQALSDAESVLLDPTATQDEVDAAMNALVDAKEKLEPAEETPAVDKQSLEATIEVAEALDESKFSEESWTALQEALTAAKAVDADENASQDDVDGATLNLITAIAELQPPAENQTETADKDALLTEYVDDVSLSESDYTPESWAPFAEALADAQSVLLNPEATQDEVDAAMNALVDAKDKLEPAEETPTVDKQGLEATIDAAEALNESNYTEETWQALQDALDAARTVDADETATQDQIDSARVDLVGAIASLKPSDENTEMADKDALLTEYVDDVSLNEKDYTPESWTPFADALSDAEDVLLNPEATQDEVDAAMNALVDAKDKLEPAESQPEPAPAVDKESLEATIDAAEALNEDNYSEETWKALQDALTAAKEVDADENATQDAVDEATLSLVTAIAGLQPPTGSQTESPDKTDLLDEYTDAMKLDESNYTPESWAPLAEALANAQSVLANPDATQDEVEAAEEALKTAMDNLEPAEGEYKDGLIKDDDGVWRLYKDNVFQRDYTGFAENTNGKWYVERGVVTFAKTDILQDKNGAIGTAGDWYYVIDSKVQEDFTGLSNFSNQYGWWYIVNGKVDFSRNSVDKNVNGWWYVTGGKVQFGFTGLANYKNEYGWWYIENGKVNFNHNGVEKNKNGWWYVTGSKVQFDFTGLANYQNDYGWWYIENGKVNFNHNGVEKNVNGWWYVTDSKVQFSFTGLANYKNQYGWWYIRSGKVDFTYTGRASNNNGTWNVVNGKVVF